MGIYWKSFRKQTRRRMTSRLSMCAEDGEEHDVVGLYWTGLGGVQSKCCRQSYGADTLCGGTVIEECSLEMLVEVDCNRGLQSHSYPFHSLQLVLCIQVQVK